MDSSPLTIWCNAIFPQAAMAELRARVAPHRLLVPNAASPSNLVATGPDPLLAEADIAFGQPDPRQIMELDRLKWVHLTSAGYTRYDRDELRENFRRRGAVLTNSSAVYAEPCAEHVFAMMLALSRRLPQCLDEQRTSRAWRAAEHRIQSRLLVGQTVLILGFGAIAQRLVELLAPFHVNIMAVRRRPIAVEGCRILPTAQTDEVLPLADHVVNLLPANAMTEGFMSRQRFARMKAGSSFYNIGRGTTVDQPALLEALNSGRLSAAYLDVTEPEPLPADHPLWSAPNCYITPHTAGGSHDEFHRLVRHFGDNLERYVAGKPLRDVVMGP